MRIHYRLKRRDWVGDAVLTIAVGAVVVASVFLPWANTKRAGDVNFSLAKAHGVLGALDTGYGAPALAIGLAVIAVGLVMLIVGPRRLAFLPGLLTMAAGVGLVELCSAVARTIYGPWGPALGLYLITLAAILAIPIGLASALVGLMMWRHERAV